MIKNHTLYQQADERRKKKIAVYKTIRYYHEKKNWSIQWMCSFFKIARASYYKWTHRKVTDREKRDAQILEVIQAVAEANNGLFGANDMYGYINNQLDVFERPVYYKTVFRLMSVNHLHTARPRYKKYHWKKSTPEITAENTLNRQFDVGEINKVWCNDITEVTAPGVPQKAYLSTILDLGDRFPVAWTVSRRNDTALVESSLDKAVGAYPVAHPLFHSDRGFQYTRQPFGTKLKRLGMKQSMSRVSRCIDNGPMEGFQGIIKEMVPILYPNISNYNELVEAINGTIEYYIYECPQRRYGYKTPHQVRCEALASNGEAPYPIKQNSRYIRFWNHIEELKHQISK